jgi:hypothetical protein
MNRNDLLSEMSIKVTVGEFHDTHDAAHQVEELLKHGAENLSVSELTDALQKLNAGQRLTDAETGPDAWCAHSYRDSIALAEKELRKREQEQFNALNLEYGEYIGELKRKWLAENRMISNGILASNVYETMDTEERAEVHGLINEWGQYITPLAEAWWKARGYKVIWPNDNEQNIKLQKLEVVEENKEDAKHT